MGKRTATFSISGAYITALCRTFWADEGEPERALKLLEAAFPTMDRSDMFCIITGSKKLVGDSNNGVDLEADNAKVSECGNDLSLEAVLGRFRKKDDEAQDWLQLATHQTEVVPSPKGPIEVPRRRTKSRKGLGDNIYLNAEYEDLKDIPHREITTDIDCRRFLNKDKRRRERLEEVGIEEVKRPAPPEARLTITQENGWLSRDGKFYPCRYWEHRDLAWSLGYDERNLETLGWIKVQKSGEDKHTMFYWEYDHFKPTQAQIDLIFDYCTKNKQEMPEGLIREN